MTRIAAAAVATGALLAALVLVVAHTSRVGGVAPTRVLEVHTSFEPPLVQFGDEVVAHVVVLADRGAVDTSRLRIVSDLAPLTRLSADRVTRTTRGRLLVVTVVTRALCSSDACLAPRLRLPAVRVEGPLRAGGTARANAVWPVLAVDSRVTASDLKPARPPLRADTSVPATTYRIAPATLARLLDIVAVLLVLAGVGFAVMQAGAVLRRTRRDSRTDVERALALVRQAAAREPDDRRRAAGLLARVLRTRDARLSADADDLAWSRPQPTSDRLVELADRVDGETG